MTAEEFMSKHGVGETPQGLDLGTGTIGAGLGLAAVGAGIIMRRPLRDAIMKIMPKTLKALPEKIPQEYPILLSRPKSPVISSAESFNVRLADEMAKVEKSPWAEIFTNRDKPEHWVDIESKAYDTWRNLGGTPEAREIAYKKMPPDVRGALEYIDKDMRPREKWAADFLSERDLPDEAAPYLPRMGEKDWDDLVKLSRYFTGLRSEIRTTLGPFEKARQYPTMAEGIAAGEKYVDPRMSVLQRIWSGHKMIQTAEYIKDLESKGAIFSDFSQAVAAAKAAGHEKPVVLEGVPGARAWWAATKEEAMFIRDQLKDPRVGGLASLVNRANLIFRNPNLFNPLPHFTKNMLYKYGWSGGEFKRVHADMKEFLNGTNPAMLAEFNKVMPFEKGGQTAHQIMLDTAAKIESNFGNKVLTVLQTPNRWSSKLIFSKWDPALRYSRWKQYVEKGMDSQEAANHVWIDLVRYGTRSDLVDFWKSIPLNFFVPWRVGTWTSFIKNMRQSPASAAMFIGSIDLLREVIYRWSGWWFHTPIDYVEGPVTRLIEAAVRDPKTAPGEAGSIAATTALFGPGGASSSVLISNLLKAIGTGKDIGPTLMNMFWGMAFVFDPYGSTVEMADFSRDQNPQHLVKVLQMAALGAHEATGHAPRRWGQWIPESILPKSQKVQAAEALQEARKRSFELRQQQPKHTIKDIVSEPSPTREWLRETLGR